MKVGGTVHRVLALILFVFVCLTTSCSPAFPSSETIVKELSSISYEGRMVGTAGNEKAVSYIENAFRMAGLSPLLTDSLLQEYEQTREDLSGTGAYLKLEYKDGTTKELKFGVDYYMQSGSQDVDVDLPLNFDGEPQQNAASIHVLESFTNPQAEKAPVLILVKDEIFFTPAFPSKGRPLRISIPGDVAERIGLPNAVRATVRAEGGALPYQSSNVVGCIPGKDRTRAIVLTAHLDGPGKQGEYFFPGAIDNASGVATLIGCASHLMKTYSKNPPDTDIVFAAVNSEEYSDGRTFPGSTALVASLKERYTNLYDINLDCIGMDNPFSMKVIDTRSAGLNQAIRDSFDEAGLEYDDSEYALSDHRSFMSEGYAVAVIGQAQMGEMVNIHHMTDSADRLDFDLIDKVVDAVSGVVSKDGSRIFDTLSSGSSVDDPRLDDDAWWERLKEESVRILDGRTLAYDEKIDFLFDGVLCQVSGWRPFKSVEDARQFFPEYRLETHMDAPLNRVEIRQSFHFGSLVASTAKPEKDTIMGVIQKVALDREKIFEVIAVFKDGERYREIVISKAMSDPFARDGELQKLTGDLSGLAMYRNSWEQEGKYSSVRVQDGSWWVSIREYTPDLTPFGKENNLVSPVLRTQAEIEDWIQRMDLGKNLDEIITACGLDVNAKD
jgi:hypothetical protein